MRVLRALLGLGMLCLLLVGCSSRADKHISVGSGDDLEQVVLGKLTVMLLREQGYDVTDRVSMGSMQDVRSALESGRVDLCWSYTGQVWQEMLGHDQPIQDTETLIRRINEDDLGNEIQWFGPWRHTQSVAVLASPELASETYSLSGLAWHMATSNPLVSVCVSEDMDGMVSGLEGLMRVYGLDFRRDAIVRTDQSEAYSGVAGGVCDCCLGYSGSAATRGLGLVPLVDDQGFFPVSELIAGMQGSCLSDPEVFFYVDSLAQELSYGALDDLVDEYVVSGESDVVLRSFLRNSGLLDVSPTVEGESVSDS